MNPLQILMNQLQNQIKMKNPQVFQQVQNLIKNNNPQDVLKDITGNYTPEQTAQFKKFMNGYGVTEEQLKQFGIK